MILPRCKIEVKKIKRDIAKLDSQVVAADRPEAEMAVTSSLSHRGILRDPDLIEQVVEFIQM